jgi:hypothetical protein
MRYMVPGTEHKLLPFSNMISMHGSRVTREKAIKVIMSSIMANGFTTDEVSTDNVSVWVVIVCCARVHCLTLFQYCVVIVCSARVHCLTLIDYCVVIVCSACSLSSS